MVMTMEFSKMIAMMETLKTLLFNSLPTYICLNLSSLNLPNIINFNSTSVALASIAYNYIYQYMYTEPSPLPPSIPLPLIPNTVLFIITNRVVHVV